MARRRTAPSADPRSPSLDPLANEILERWKTVSEHYADWNEEAKDDYAFALGDQWSDEDRTTLKAQKRPCLTFNRIKPLLNLVSGYQRENAARIKVNPEGGEDRIFSEVCDRLIKALDKWAHLDYVMSYWFDDGATCGKGFMEAVLEYERDPVRGDLYLKQLSPYSVLPDPDHLDYDLNRGARYVFKHVRLSRQTLLDLYPKAKSLISGFIKDVDDPVLNGMGLLTKEGGDDDYGNRPSKSSITRASDAVVENAFEGDTHYTVKEYWRPKRVPQYFVLNVQSGDPVYFETEEEAQLFLAEQQAKTPGFGTVESRQVKQMWVAAYIAGHVVQDVKSPFEPHYHGYPFFRYLADWIPNADDETVRVQGIVRALKDPQREKNKAKSQTLHILNTQANSGWVGDEDALTDEGWKKLQTMGATPGVVVRKKKGAELREILPKGPNQGHLVREQQADEEFTKISGINPDLLGFNEKTASGRAISLRIRQAVLSLVRLFTNYRYSKEILGNFLLEMVPALFDTKKLSRTLGPAYLAKAVDPQKYPQGLDVGHLDGFLTLIKDHRYDVYVTEADQNQTIRFEIFQELTELLKAGAPIPMDLLIEYLDLPNSEEVKQRIQQAQAQQAATMAAGKPGTPPAGAQQ